MAKKETKKQKEEDEIEDKNKNEEEKEISDEEFEQFIQQNRFSNNFDFAERVAPVLEATEISNENLEESLTDVDTKNEKGKSNIDYSIGRGYGDLYIMKNYETEVYNPKTYDDLSETRKLDIGRSLMDNVIEEKAIDLGKLNMQKQQITPMMQKQQEDNRRYLEIKQTQALEERGIPFDRRIRKKERILK